MSPRSDADPPDQQRTTDASDPHVTDSGKLSKRDPQSSCISVSDPSIQITLQALVDEMRDAWTEDVIDYKYVAEWANRLAALLPVRQQEEPTTENAKE